jgi:hypothetical protein
VPFGLACLATLIALFYAEENWRGKRAWEKYKRQLEAQGERLELAGFVPRPVPDDENFAMTPFLAPLFDFKPGTHEWRDRNALQRAQGFAPRYQAASRLLSWQPHKRLNSWTMPPTGLLQAWYAAFLQGTNPPAQPKPKMGWQAASVQGTNPLAQPKPDIVLTNLTLQEAAAGVLAGLSESDPVIEELRTASRRPHSRFNIPYHEELWPAIPLPHLAPLKSACQILQLRASAELALGRNDAALDDTRMIFDLADAIRDEPFVISYLVRIAELHMACWPLAEGLAGHQWSEAQLRALQERLRRVDLCADAKRVLEAERVLAGVILIDNLRRSADKYAMINQFGALSDTPQGKNIRVCAAAAPTGWSYFEQLNFNRLFQDYLLPTIDVTKRHIAPGATRRLTEQLDSGLSHSELRRFLRHELFLQGVVRDFCPLPERVAFDQTGLDAVALACALERYRLARGQFPDSLDALSPQFIDKVPPDIINGQPLKYRRTQDGQFVLYSVGWNETDDGGTVGHTREAGDWVWR